MSFGDRKDAVRVRNMDGMHMIMCDIKPLRADSDVYINQKIDVTELVKYIENKKKTEEGLTYFHAFSTAIAKVFYNRPLLNRFVLNKHFYDRKEVSLSFVAKVDFEDDSPEYLNVIRVGENDTLIDVKNKISGTVKKVRSNSKNGTDDAINIVGKLPRFLRVFVMWLLKKLDNHGLIPYSLIENDIYHSSIILSNLGSIDCGAIYHNLTDFGTNSILMTIGKIHKEQVVMDNGNVEIRDVCDFGVNVDERIADGVYFAKSIKLFEYILQNPELLETKVSEKVERKN